MDYATHTYELFREDIHWLRSKTAPELPKTFGSTCINDNHVYRVDDPLYPTEVFRD